MPRQFSATASSGAMMTTTMPSSSSFSRIPHDRRHTRRVRDQRDVLLLSVRMMTPAFLAGALFMLAAQHCVNLAHTIISMNDIINGGGMSQRHRSLTLLRRTQHDDDERRSMTRQPTAALLVDFAQPSALSWSDATQPISVNRSDFLQHFPLGYTTDRLDQDVTLMFGSERAVPVTSSDQDSLSALSATARCDELQVVVLPVHHDKVRQCLAIVPDAHPSPIVHKWDRKNINPKNPLRPVAAKAPYYLPVPTTEQTAQANAALQQYLTALPNALDRLRLIVPPLVGGRSANKRRPIMVMVANAGHMDFFTNFVCAARAHHIDLSSLLLFATDASSHEQAAALQITSYYDAAIFGDMPEDAAQDYKDQNYARIMMSKVFSVHLVNQLQHDLLFLDVDVVLYRDPIPYFTNLIRWQEQTLPGGAFDMYYQHDGDSSKDQRFMPLQANTGVYYVRSNARTRYFYDDLVRHGDLVLATGSHQAAVTTLASEHMSTRGLRVQVIKHDAAQFPTGEHYHSIARVIKHLRWLAYRSKPFDPNDTQLPYLFHANWLLGSAAKQRAFQFLGSWYVVDTTTACPNGQTHCCRLDGRPMAAKDVKNMFLSEDKLLPVSSIAE